MEVVLCVVFGLIICEVALFAGLDPDRWPFWVVVIPLSGLSAVLVGEVFR